MGKKRVIANIICDGDDDETTCTIKTAPEELNCVIPKYNSKFKPTLHNTHIQYSHQINHLLKLITIFNFRKIKEKDCLCSVLGCDWKETNFKC